MIAWLDDTEVIDPGAVQLSFGVSRWRSRFGHETDAPSLFAAVGLAPRTQIAVSGLRYASAFTDGFTSSGRGDMYLIAKVAVVSPRAHPGGVALSPLVEILSDLSLAYQGAGAGRVTWGLPVNLQYTFVKYRVYGSTGYFSRGSVFGSGAIEMFVAPSVVATANVLYSHATRTTVLSEQYGLKRQHTDVNIGAYVLASDVVTIYGSAGRTITGLDSSSATAIGTIGVSFKIGGRSTQP